MIASDEAVFRLTKFTEELAKLCRKYAVAIETTDGDAAVELVDLTRPTCPDWPWSASLAGVDREGEVDRLSFYSIDAQNFPEDHAALTSARSKGQPW